ncbi:hypothetical protein [Mucilaginibacter psychrotolerans]|uniref:Uncharacterized protein n=1 Tax=Mucilaginibacter psychrotolerans TaxID=1524096 RepID=A0A4Y8SB81_9SPHI|nr:hypothetical protein [Mucilaginibacter psychrotolerans]TFF35905.1 hypothetical protein E2R66_16950 [Mucilaginibacter psychrotolerans]
MGLDISIATNNYEEVYSPDYYDEENNYFSTHNLSRTFCNFICRRNVISHEPELDQIGKLTGVDINPIYSMEDYPVGDGLEFFLEKAETEEERQAILRDAKERKEQLEGNIDLVIATISNLIANLAMIKNLPALLQQTDFDSLDNDDYFSDFDIDKGDGYIGNNFGQDLRNFERSLKFAKEKNATTVWFTYG